METDIKQLEDEKDNLDVKDQKGIKKSRIELPFNIWCGGCGRHIAKNVRFNSEKKQIGSYYRTPIFEFIFSCPSCSQIIKMQSNPKDANYKISFGAKEKIEGSADDENRDEREKLKRETNPFAFLEHRLKVEESAKDAAPMIDAIKEATDVFRKEDFAMNQQLRKDHRILRKNENLSRIRAQKVQKKLSLDVKLGPEIPTDKLEASRVHFSKNGI